MAKKQIKRTRAKVYKICQKCLRECMPKEDICICGSEKFAPKWVKKLEKINRQFSVQVTEPDKSRFGADVPDRRITLYKWWPGDSSSLHINKSEEWEKIQDIINNRLWKHVGWKTKQELVKDLKNGKEDDVARNIVRDHPQLIQKILKGIDYKNIDETELPDAFSAVKELTEAVEGADAGIVTAIKSLIKKLPKQGKRAIEDLETVLEQWSLKQVNSVTLEVKHRLDTLEIFEKAILNDKTYEIRGSGSIHRILENAMWIIDERYWLMHSNETLRTIVGDKIHKKVAKRKRPDFVCGSVGNKVVIVEIKRPSHKLTIEDLNQLENYLSVIEEHSGDEAKTFEAYLVGKSISKDLAAKKKYRSSQFKIRTYVDLIDDLKSRYSEFYKAIK